MLNFSKMVDLARTPDEIKEENAEYAKSSPSDMKLPRYSYGTCLSLDNDALEKLGLDGDLPSVGEEVQFCARAKVTSASTNEREGVDGKVEVCKRVELQITHMGVPAEDAVGQSIDASKARQQRFYGSSDATAD